MPFRKNIDMDLLRSFNTIVELGSFTRAAERLARTQSAISLQMKRLEETAGASLFERGGRGVTPTQTGHVLLGYARRILAENDELVARLAEPEVEGLLRLGAPEDFATCHLIDVLARFGRAFPRVTLEFTCDGSARLLEGHAAGQYDLVLAKRACADPAANPAAETGNAPSGVPIRRDPLVWAGTPDQARADRLALVLAPEPCVARAGVTAALYHARRPWRVAMIAPSIASMRAAVAAGLGIAALPRAMAGDGLRILGPESGLPALPDIEIALHLADGAGIAACRMAEFIVAVLDGD
jgi:DNA-binding transcriptional LysR family regulator